MIGNSIKKNKWNIILFFIVVIGIGLCAFFDKVLSEKYQFYIDLSRDLLLYSYTIYIVIQIIGKIRKIWEMGEDVNNENEQKYVNDRVYYIKEIAFCYPHDIARSIKNYGDLCEYENKTFNRSDIDIVISELIMRHPYVPGAINLKITVVYKEGEVEENYHVLYFANEKYEEQNKEDMALVKFENR